MCCAVFKMDAVPAQLREDTGRDDLIPLALAAMLAFPDGSMNERGLRRERDKGRLEVYQICNRDYTTLNDIDRMKARCLVKKQPDFTSTPNGGLAANSSSAPSGSSGTADTGVPLDAARMTLRELRKRSVNTLLKSTKLPAPNVTPIRSGSRTL